MGGAFPSFAPIRDEIGHPTLDLFDPFGLSKNASPEKKERGLLIEINNGRLAMIGIMSFMCAAKGLVVPGLDFIPAYAGEPMGFFAAATRSCRLCPRCWMRSRARRSPFTSERGGGSRSPQRPPRRDSALAHAVSGHGRRAAVNSGGRATGHAAC